MVLALGKGLTHRGQGTLLVEGFVASRGTPCSISISQSGRPRRRQSQKGKMSPSRDEKAGDWAQDAGVAIHREGTLGEGGKRERQ